MFDHALIEKLLDRDDTEVRAIPRYRRKFTLTRSHLCVVEADMDDLASLDPVTRNITHVLVTSPMDEQLTARENALRASPLCF